MSTTFDDARAVVLNDLRHSDWPIDDELVGHLIVATWGYENAHTFLIIAGAREALIDDNFDFVGLDAPSYVVDKATGILTRVPWHEALGAFEDMTPIGVGNPDHIEESHAQVAVDDTPEPMRGHLQTTEYTAVYGVFPFIPPV